MHNLTMFVLNCFKTPEQAHDRTSIAVALGSPSRPGKAVKAFLIVAEDVLGCMQQQGLLVADRPGWLRMTEAGRMCRESAQK